MGSHNIIPFTPEQDAFIIALHKRFSIYFMAARLHRSPLAVEQRLIELGLRPKEQLTEAPQRTNILHIIKPLPEKQEYYLRGKIAESVILGLV